MKHYTNKKTNEVFGYESIEDAKKFNDDFKNLVEMTEDQFIVFRDNRPKGGKWTWDKGWVIDDELLKQEELQDLQYELDQKESEKSTIIVEMQKNFLLGKEDKARSSAQTLDTLEKEIMSIKDKIDKLS